MIQKIQFKEKIQFKVKPRMINRWFLKDKKVYDVVEVSISNKWVDPTYGNGGGDFISFESEEVLYSFDTFGEADTFRQEMENYLNCIY